MIPRTIHYCWFGKGPKPKNISKYIESWKKQCVDYEVVEWNEDNFDININEYCKVAYIKKKWAFVSDFARLWIIYNHGGIYLDTDVEIVKPLDPLLINDGFIGFESKEWIGTNIIGAAKNNKIIKRLLQNYDSNSFINHDGSLNMTTNVEIITKILNKEYGLKSNGLQQNINGFEIYPIEYFSPYDYLTGIEKKTNNTYTIHWYTQTWINQAIFRRKISQLLHRVLGIRFTSKIHKLLK